MLVCNSGKQYIVALKLVSGVGLITYTKCGKCHLFDANIRHVGISREKNLWSTISLESNTCHN